MNLITPFAIEVASALFQLTSLCNLIGCSMLLELAQRFELVTTDPSRHMTSPCASLGEKQSDERRRISSAYSQKVVRTNEIARLVIIT